MLMKAQSLQYIVFIAPADRVESLEAWRKTWAPPGLRHSWRYEVGSLGRQSWKPTHRACAAELPPVAVRRILADLPDGIVYITGGAQAPHALLTAHGWITSRHAAAFAKLKTAYAARIIERRETADQIALSRERASAQRAASKARAAILSVAAERAAIIQAIADHQLPVDTPMPEYPQT